MAAIFVILISGFSYLKPLLKRECEMRHGDRVILLAALLLFYCIREKPECLEGVRIYEI